jgi:hypothetical protein
MAFAAAAAFVCVVMRHVAIQYGLDVPPPCAVSEAAVLRDRRCRVDRRTTRMAVSAAERERGHSATGGDAISAVARPHIVIPQ